MHQGSSGPTMRRSGHKQAPPRRAGGGAAHTPVLCQAASQHHLRPTSPITAPAVSQAPGRHAVRATAVAAPERAAPAAKAGGPTALLHGLGDLGGVAPSHMPFLLRLANAKARYSGGDSNRALQESARGLAAWRAAMERGLMPDDEALQQLVDEGEPFTAGHTAQELRWPADPLRTALIRVLSKLGVARFARKYPGVKDALLRAVLDIVCRYERILAGEAEVEAQREKDQYGNVFKTAVELMREEELARAARSGKGVDSVAPAAAERAKKAVDLSVPLDRRTSIDLAKEMFLRWRLPVETLSRAGRAFAGMEALLGGGRDGSFDLGGNIWARPGWAQMDELRKRLEDLKELRDLVRSLGRGGGWGPLRRAPIQYLDFKGRPGLLRTVLEQQETRGMTRSDDVSRLLPAEAALLARGATVRQAKLLFYARLAEKSLQCYERDGWGEYPTNIIPERREVRPTADRGPILLCVDTSGSMRGPREVVAKALALECMRAAKEQERQCYVFCFAGPAEVRELELNVDMKSVNNLLDFLEKVFNGGSDFNEPVKRCLERLNDAKWANSDILLVSDGELRQPGPEIMRKLSGAKEKLGLRVHGLIVGSPEKKRADPAVLRSLCNNILPSGKSESLVSEFSGWASVQADTSFNFDWDDSEGNASRRLAGLELEKRRQAEMRRRRSDEKAKGGKVDRNASAAPQDGEEGGSSVIRGRNAAAGPQDGSGNKIAAGRKH